MAQKTHSNIFRLGKNLEWKSKYFEKKPEELSAYNFKNLEIKTYIKHFLKENGLLVQDFKINFYKSNIKIYIPYYVTLNSSFLINQKKLNQHLKIKKKKFKTKKKYQYSLLPLK